MNHDPLTPVRRPMPKPDSILGHPGELALRERFPSMYHWDERSLAVMMKPFIPMAMARLLESLPFFFISTANADGHCDCSFRGQELDASGRPLPIASVIDEKHLAFPDFPGNGLYNSLGNILTNPHIGMLFMDFERQRRFRVNGVATIAEADDQIRAIWPTAQAAVIVTVEQAYGNCQARIPRLVTSEATIA